MMKQTLTPAQKAKRTRIRSLRTDLDEALDRFNDAADVLDAARCEVYRIGGRLERVMGKPEPAWRDTVDPQPTPYARPDFDDVSYWSK